jgi:glycosyltransferase involved in cell wall biosynthesis
LRVAFIGGRGVGSKYSGIETWYEEVGERLAVAGHDVTVYCRSYFTRDQETYRGLRVLRFPTVRTKHLETFVHTALSAVHASFRPYDVVHFHALGPSLFSFLPRLTGKKTIVSVQGLDWQRKKWGKVAAAVLRVGERTAALFPNSTIVVSRTLQQYYRDRYGAVTTYIPNGTDLFGRSSIRCLDNWKLAPQCYVLFLGRFSPEKNCDLLIRAFHDINTDLKLVLAGGSSYSDRYAQELRRQAGENVLLLDWIGGEALEELITNAMLFVLPSDMEGLSLALLDAMAAGLCVLASDVPENRELVDGAGFTFRRGNQEDLQNKLRMLIGDASLRETAGRAARKRIHETYLWPEIARQVEQEYRRVLGLEDAAGPHTASTGQYAA